MLDNGLQEMTEKFYSEKQTVCYQVFLTPHLDSPCGFCGINIHILDKIVQLPQRAENWPSCI